MRNLTTKNETNRVTDYISKSFNVLTAKGNDVVVSITRRVINVTSESFKSGFTYSVSYKGELISERMTKKEDVFYYLNFVDKYSDKY